MTHITWEKVVAITVFRSIYIYIIHWYYCVRHVPSVPIIYSNYLSIMDVHIIYIYIYIYINIYVIVLWIFIYNVLIYIMGLSFSYSPYVYSIYSKKMPTIELFMRKTIFLVVVKRKYMRNKWFSGFVSNHQKWGECWDSINTILTYVEILLNISK